MITLALVAALQTAAASPQSLPVHPMVIVREQDVRVRQTPPPHDGVGESTAYRLSDAAPLRNFEFRKRALHPGASIGLHVLGHDEIYYVVSGRGLVESDGEERELTAESAAYLYEGANVGIRQQGAEDLVLIVAYPLAARRPALER